MILTSVRVTAKEWEWVKSHPGLEFSAILRSRIHQLMRDEQYKTADPKALLVQEWRKMGLKDEEIAVKLVAETSAGGEPNPPNPPNPNVTDERVSQVSQVSHPPRESRPLSSE